MGQNMGNMGNMGQVGALQSQSQYRKNMIDNFLMLCVLFFVWRCGGKVVAEVRLVEIDLYTYCGLRTISLIYLLYTFKFIYLFIIYIIQ